MTANSPLQRRACGTAILAVRLHGRMYANATALVILFLAVLLQARDARATPDMVKEC